MLESVRSLTTLFDTPLQVPPAAFHLLIMGPDLFLAQALPKNGNLTIGRADNADIRITDPLASRLHARLHVGEGGLFEIEDIGSINRTKVRDVALEHGERVAVLPGEAVTIGSTILMVQETRAAARNRRVWPHTHFEARIEEECVRAARRGRRSRSSASPSRATSPPAPSRTRSRPRCARPTCWRCSAPATTRSSCPPRRPSWARRSTTT